MLDTLLGGVDHMAVFIGAGLLLNLTPGPDVLYIITHALKSGWRAGAVAALGINAGCFVHIVAAALGVSALLAASATAFTVLKWLGAAYLVYVGWSMLGLPLRLRLRPAAQADLPSAPHVDTPDLGATKPEFTRLEGQKTLKSIFIKGFWTNALNPKVALFFLAFLPQFISPVAAHASWIFVLLGLVFNFNSVWINLGWAALGALVSSQLAQVQRFMRQLERVAGVMFVGFGVRLALSAAPHG